jgi:hypothetical protein
LSFVRLVVRVFYRVGPPGAPKAGIVRAKHDPRRMKALSRGRLVMKKALVVESKIGVSSKASSNSSSGSHISGSILQRSGWEYNIVSDLERVHLVEGLQQCTVVIVDSLVFAPAQPAEGASAPPSAPTTPSALVASLRAAGYQLAVVCLLQHSSESLREMDCFDGTITKPLHSSTDKLLDIATTCFLNVALWINNSE